MQTDEAEAYIPKLPPVMIRKAENIHTLLKALSETYGEAIKMRRNRKHVKCFPADLDTQLKLTSYIRKSKIDYFTVTPKNHQSYTKRTCNLDDIIDELLDLGFTSVTIFQLKSKSKRTDTSLANTAPENGE
ncbi:hypothetical protein CEXT_677081 [Caerostris extrusa]|uniref:Uncharacterized protein n=1 Tax=Caerostris extrusa TaxID=172846 RepID=A0AAV4NIJ8_CAEEX|nr:hypothetical protein CEXT_677081 [Caerostris extrusa]